MNGRLLTPQRATIHRIALSAIALDAGTQIREALNELVVAEYAEQMAAGARFPPIVVFTDHAPSTAHYLADGFHRVEAARRNQVNEIEAEILVGGHLEALWFALGANNAHGQRLTQGDKKRAIVLALQAWPDRSTNQIAAQIGVTHQYVGEVRSQVAATCNLPDRVTGKDGKSYPAQVPRQHNGHAQHDQIAQRLRAGTTVATIAQELHVDKGTIGRIRRSLGLGRDLTRAGVAARRATMRELAAAGHTSRQIARALHLNLAACRESMRAHEIDVPADRVVGRARHHTSAHIVQQIVLAAENLLTGAELIDFTDLDETQRAAWADSLKTSRQALTAFIHQLQPKGEPTDEASNQREGATRSCGIESATGAD